MHYRSSPTTRLLQPFILLHLIILTGIIGFMLIEHLNVLDAVYMTTIFITTVGYGDYPLTDAGRIFSVFLLVTSWATFAFVIARITQFVLNGEIHQYFLNRKRMKVIASMNNHVILCGFGRNGQQASHTLRSHGVPFVVIEKNEHLIEKLESHEKNLVYIEGDGTDDEILKSAGVDKARALITTLPDDADNVFIVLSARSLNPGINIISRASEYSSVAKLRKAGANNVIMPDYIGGTHMATLVSKPDVVEFIDFLSGEQGQSIHVEAVGHEELPPTIREKSLADIMLWKHTGVNCVGIKDEEGRFIINPPGDTRLGKGMKILVLGTRQQIGEMKTNLKAG